MAKSYEGLKADATVIKNEIEANKNTATRVGTMFVDLVEKVEDVNSSLDNDITSVNTRIDSVTEEHGKDVTDLNARIDSVVNDNVQTISYVVQSVNEALDTKQDKLVSGENVKTVNSESIVGSGDLFTHIDVSPLFEVGGTMAVSGTDLLTHHLYVRTYNYVSNVSVCVGNQEYILEAKRRLTMASYDTGIVKAIVEFTDGVPTCTNVII